MTLEPSLKVVLEAKDTWLCDANGTKIYRLQSADDWDVVASFPMEMFDALLATGNVNRLKLAAWPQVVEALRNLSAGLVARYVNCPAEPLDFTLDKLYETRKVVDAALALAERAEKGEGT